MWVPVRTLTRQDMLYRLALPLSNPSATCPATLTGGGLCGLRLCRAVGIPSVVCPNCLTVYAWHEVYAPERFHRGDDGVLYAEASDLGWPAGSWPEVVIVGEEKCQRTEISMTGGVYRSAKQTLMIFND